MSQEIANLSLIGGVWKQLNGHGYLKLSNNSSFIVIIDKSYVVLITNLKLFTTILSLPVGPIIHIDA